MADLNTNTTELQEIKEILENKAAATSGLRTELTNGTFVPKYAAQLETARTISLTGDVTGSSSFDGSANISIDTSIANQKVFYGVCDSAGTLAQKVITTVNGDWQPIEGSILVVRFNTLNSANTVITFKVDDATAVPVYYNNANIGSDLLALFGGAGRHGTFVYRDSKFHILSHESFYIKPVNLGTGITTCYPVLFLTTGAGAVVEPKYITKISIAGNNGNITTEGEIEAASYNATSDARLKKNFEIFTPKASILELPTYKFDFIDGATDQIGCKAQDLQEICPELVVEREDGYLAIKESKLVYLLLEEVKKLNEGFQKLQEENEILKQKVEKLEG